jgi:hypothetical protein
LKAEAAMGIAVGFAVPSAAANGLNHRGLGQIGSVIDHYLAGNENG